MKALRWHGPRDLRLVELAESSLQPNEVRVRVAYCGICGSDLHEYVDGPHAIPVDCPHPISGRRAPLTLGHEFCGTVVESADPRLGVGTRVAIEPEYRCGECDCCRRGQYNRCTSMGFVGLMGDGGMAESVVVPSYTGSSASRRGALRPGGCARTGGSGIARRADQWAAGGGRLCGVRHGAR